MATVKSRALTPGLVDEINSIISILGETEGGIFYVSTSGNDDNNGRTLESAFRTLTYAISQCTSGQSDRVFLAPGTYDEASTTGVPANKANVTFQGIKAPVIITNSNPAGDKVLNITANNCTFVNIQVKKGETSSSGSSCFYIDGATNTRFRDVKVIIEKAGFYGYRYTGGSHGGYIGFGDRRYSIIISETLTQTGIGIYFENCYHVMVEDLCITGMEKGLLFGTDGDNNGINYGVTIAYCTTGIELESGASNNGLCASIVACNIDILNNSGNATNDYHGSLTHLHESIEHIEKFTGKIWFVDGLNGLDTNSGENPEEAFATIGNAIASASAGDAITVKEGDYYETNLDLNLVGLELWGEIGVVIYNTTGTGLTVSGGRCRVKEVILSTPGQTSLDLSGNHCVIESVTASSPSIGISISGRSNRLRDITVGSPSTTGIDISGPYNELRGVGVSNSRKAARGFYLSSSNAKQNTLIDCNSMGNTIAGFEVVIGSNLNSFIKCTSGGGDGKRLDNGNFNLWDIIEQLTTEHNERMHPMSDGEGTAGLPVTVDNTATDDFPDTRSDRWYWGDTVAIILPDILTTFWNSIGIYIFATTINKVCQWQIWFPNARFRTTRNGGNLWDYSETLLTVADASLFQEDDLVWIRSDSDPNGEILVVSSITGNVITIASETRLSGHTGVRYNHAGNEAMYLISRSTDDRFTPIEGGYSAGSAKDSYRYMWHFPKELPGNSAMIMRVLDTLDNLDVSFDIAALYEI